MSPSSRQRWTTVVITILLAGTVGLAGPLPGARPGTVAVDPQVPEATAGPPPTVPLGFEANQGQIDAQVDFVARAPGFDLFLSGGEAVFALADGASLRMTPTGTSRRPKAEGTGRQPGERNYYLGNDPAGWVTGVASYDRVRYRDVYPGIDLVYYTAGGHLEYDLVVAPGADSGVAGFSFEGADGLSLGPKGDLRISTPAGTVGQNKPVIYQEVDGARRKVDGAFVLDGPDRVVFRVGRYDPDRPLIIDPVLTWATYLGGGPLQGTGTTTGGFDSGNTIDLTTDDTTTPEDEGGQVIVAGNTSSLNFPVKNADAAQPRPGGGTDAFVAKFSPTGTLLWATYLGGSGSDFAADVSNGWQYLFVVGSTNSADFPRTDIRARGGGVCGTIPCYDGFLSKLEHSGRLSTSRYIGGVGNDDTTGVVVEDDYGSRVYLTGTTSSPVAPAVGGFPTGTRQGFQPAPAGGKDAFVLAIETGAAMVIEWSSFLGGAGDEEATGVALGPRVEGKRDVYVAGSTQSATFPTTAPLKHGAGGSGDTFVARIADPSGGPPPTLSWYAYLGGTGYDSASGIAVDGAGAAYVAGVTGSSNFPTTPGTPQGSFKGVYEGFVAKITPDGSDLGYATYIGGDNYDSASGIDVDDAGHAFVTGSTSSSDFPLVSTLEVPSGHPAAGGAFLAEIGTAGDSFEYSVVLGGTASGSSVAASPQGGTAYVTGISSSTGLATDGAAQENFAEGGADAFVARIDNPVDHTAPDTTITAGPRRVTHLTAASFSFTSSENGSTFACSLDGAPAMACTSPQPYEGLIPGPHLFTVAATDRAGNTDSTPAEWSFTILAAEAGFTWRQGEAMAVPHSIHTATVLDGPLCRSESRPDYCGKVLVAGGAGPAELYDPATGIWSPTGAMRTPRRQHAAVLLDGAACRRPAPPPPPTTTTTTTTTLVALPTSTTTPTTMPPPPTATDNCGKVLVVGGTAGNADVDTTAKMVELYDPATGTWIETGGQGPRYGHTLTVLDGPSCRGNQPADHCGLVLAAGGMQSALYEPSTGHELPNDRATMNSTRFRHTATVLDGPPCRSSAPPNWCGKVLAQGGAYSFSPSDDLYDPATNKWTATGTTDAPDVENPAALLDGPACRSASPPDYCGKVLAVISGAPSQMYDPVDGSWTSTGVTINPHQGGKAVLLDGPPCRSVPAPASCGRVLVVGGHGDGAEADASASAEIYDPLNGEWIEVGSMDTARYLHTATLLPGGEVLVTGGRTKGCCEAVHDVGSTEIFNPSLVGDPPAVGFVQPRRGPTRGGTTIVVRGLGLDSVTGVEMAGVPATFRVDSPSRLSVVSPAHATGPVDLQLFTGAVASPTPARFTYAEEAEFSAPTITMVSPTSGPTGGGPEVRILGSGFVFSAADTSVRFGDQGATAVSIVADTVLIVTPPASAQGKVPVTVTTPRGPSPPSVAAHFSYGSGAWSPVPSLTTCTGASAPCTGRSHHTATLLDGPACRGASPPAYCGKVLVAGGNTRECTAANILKSALLYDPATKNWTTTGDMVAPRSGHTATLLADGRVLVAGGNNDDACQALGSAEIYDPASGTWSGMPNGLSPRYSHTATRLDDGTVLVIGGVVNESNRQVTGGIKRWDPDTGEWTPAGSTNPREGHTATLLADGTVLIAGGRDSSGALRQAERWDPATPETSTAAADLGVARFGHTATVVTGPACQSATPPGPCGKVLVAGGLAATTSGSDNIPVHLDSAELYDPVADTWDGTGSLNDARGGHTATMLESGRVLVAGAGLTVYGGSEGSSRAQAGAEVYEPRTGRWSRTGAMAVARGLATATLLDGPGCASATRPAWCGRVLAVAGAGSGNGHDPPALAGAELYQESPYVTAVEPRRGPLAGGTAVVITGAGFGGPAPVSVNFGATPATSVTVEAPGRLRAVAPAGAAAGPVQVAVANDVGTSARLTALAASRFVYIGPVGAVTDLAANAISPSEVELAFTPPDDGSTLAPATEFIVKQSPADITPANFDAATSLCEGGVCKYPPTARVELRVADLEAATTYHYAVRAIGTDGNPGPISDDVAVTTLALPVTPPAPPCSSPPPGGEGRVTFPGGRYSLVGLPHGTVVPSQAPLYGWFNQGAGGSYAATLATEPVAGGRGYWAWFACPVTVEVGDGAPSANFPLAAYHASLVGNPSGRAPAVVSGYDYAARWEPTLNDGAGGYRISGYQVPEELAVGEGLWTFSYTGGQLSITER